VIIDLSDTTNMSTFHPEPCGKASEFTIKQLRSFIGAVNFYQDMFLQHSHILALLTALATGKGPIPWSSECQASFDTMKALLAKDAFLQYLDHNKRFDI
jgi:hypothetical protein